MKLLTRRHDNGAGASSIRLSGGRRARGSNCAGRRNPSSKRRFDRRAARLSVVRLRDCSRCQALPFRRTQEAGLCAAASAGRSRRTASAPSMSCRMHLSSSSSASTHNSRCRLIFLKSFRISGPKELRLPRSATESENWRLCVRIVRRAISAKWIQSQNGPPSP